MPVSIFTIREVGVTRDFFQMLQETICFVTPQDTHLPPKSFSEATGGTGVGSGGGTSATMNLGLAASSTFSRTP